MGEETIVASRARSLLGVGVCAVFTALAVVMVDRPSPSINPALTWVVLVVFGFVGLPIMILQALRPRRLIIRSDGVELVGSFGPSKLVTWSEVEDFFVWRVEMSTQVAYRPHRSEGVIAIRSLGGAWPGGAERTVDLLNRHLTEWTKSLADRRPNER
jgi:hypothetical protein